MTMELMRNGIFSQRNGQRFFRNGKSPCDGIGGTVKRLAARASLQAMDAGHIMTSSQLFQWANTNIKGITFFYLSTEEVQECNKTLQSRFVSVKTVAGTRSHHRF